MRYRLAVLTHGSDVEMLSDVFGSFVEYVTPQPTDCIVVQDGPGEFTIPDGFQGYAGQPWVGQVGFCEATRRLWEMASKSRELNYGERGNGFYIPEPPPFIFWLEHDFLFTRPLDLAPIAEHLLMDTRLAQMALMRNAVNEQEVEAGGLFESRRSEYEQVWTNLITTDEAFPFLRHRSYFTTNPSLMTTEFMRKNEWPDHADQCEGRFGLDLIDLGYDFGVWGEGDPWVEHIGVRTGKGY